MPARHCDSEGRDFLAINKTIVARGDPLTDIDGVLSNMQPYTRLGIQQVCLSAAPPDPAGQTQQITRQAVAQLSEL